MADEAFAEDSLELFLDPRVPVAASADLCRHPRAKLIWSSSVFEDSGERDWPPREGPCAATMRGALPHAAKSMSRELQRKLKRLVPLFASTKKPAPDQTRRVPPNPDWGIAASPEQSWSTVSG